MEILREVKGGRVEKRNLGGSSTEFNKVIKFEWKLCFGYRMKFAFDVKQSFDTVASE